MRVAASSPPHTRCAGTDRDAPGAHSCFDHAFGFCSVMRIIAPVFENELSSALLRLGGLGPGTTELHF